MLSGIFSIYSRPPPVLWAQRDTCVYLTICVEDSKDPIVKLEENSVYYKSKGGDGVDYELTIDLFDSIDPETSEQVSRPRGTELVLNKKKQGEPYWPRLTKSSQKRHWLKVDFNKWKDEDDSDSEVGGMGGMPGMGGMGGMPGMGGMGGMPGMGGGDGDFESVSLKYYEVLRV